MTDRQEKFCLAYASCGNATQSAIEAGYSAKTARSCGQRMLTNADIQHRLQELHEQIESEKIADAKEMQEVLTRIIRQELEEEVIVVEGCGDGVSEAVTKKKKSSLHDITKAIDTLAKIQGVYSSGANVNVVIPVFGGEDQLED